jgi:hypothetical protein
MTARYTTCRYLGRYGDPCTAEAVDPDGELLLCEGHLALALELLARRIPGLGALIAAGNA